MKQPDSSISNTNGKSAVKDARTRQLFCKSDDLIERSKRIMDKGRVLHKHFETLNAQSLRIISDNEMLFYITRK